MVKTANRNGASMQTRVTVIEAVLQEAILYRRLLMQSDAAGTATETQTMTRVAKAR
jgi:hypothetical protein